MTIGQFLPADIDLRPGVKIGGAQRLLLGVKDADVTEEASDGCNGI
jgi:hypothetical protein